MFFGTHEFWRGEIFRYALNSVRAAGRVAALDVTRIDFQY